MNQSTIMKASMDTPRVDTHGHLYGDIRDLTRGGLGVLLLDGCEALYGMTIERPPKPETLENVRKAAAELRAGGREATLKTTFETAHIRTQIGFCNFQVSDVEQKLDIQEDIRFFAYIDSAILGTQVGWDGMKGLMARGGSHIASLEETHGTKLEDLDALLSIIDSSIDAWKANHVVGMKVSFAYLDHGLAITDPPRVDAERAFAKREEMTLEESAAVRDFALRHACDACLRNGVPVVIHTGYPAGGTVNVMQTNPALMQGMFMDPRWADLTFVILHGGYPYTGETAYLAAKLPNVMLDFTGLPTHIPASFRQAMGEWLEMVPSGKFVWGSDSHLYPEQIVGIDRFSRRMIGEALELQVADRMMTEDQALRFVEKVSYGNADRIFGLKT